MTDKTQKINTLFSDAQKRFTEWLKGKPTGKFSISIDVNQGGIRGNPKVVKSQNL